MSESTEVAYRRALEAKFSLGELPEQREKMLSRKWCPRCRTKRGRPRLEAGRFKQSGCATCNATGMVDGSIVVGAS